VPDNKVDFHEIVTLTPATAIQCKMVPNNLFTLRNDESSRTELQKLFLQECNNDDCFELTLDPNNDGVCLDLVKVNGNEDKEKSFYTLACNMGIIYKKVNYLLTFCYV